MPLLAPEGEVVILMKPQFEVGRDFVGKGGIVRDPAAADRACEKMAARWPSRGFKRN